LTPEEIEDLLIDPDPHIPSHHQVDPRIIKAYLTGESVPTYHPGYWLSQYFRILPAIDSFQVSWQYPWLMLTIARIIIYGRKDWTQI
jgi:hypothetical protein